MLMLNVVSIRRNRSTSSCDQSRRTLARFARLRSRSSASCCNPGGWLPACGPTALSELGAFLDELIDAKLADPREDLLSRLAEEYLRPGIIDRREAITIGMTLLVAGFETTGNMINLGTALLLSHPDQLTKFLDGDETFDISRSARHHLAFSYGPHQCLGQALARLELLLYYRTIFTSVPGIQLTESPEEFDLKADMRAHGFNSLEVAW